MCPAVHLHKVALKWETIKVKEKKSNWWQSCTVWDNMSPAWGWTKASHWPGECATFTLQDRSGHNKITISFHNVKNTLPFEGFKNLYVDVAAGHTHPADDRPQPQLDGLWRPGSLDNRELRGLVAGGPAGQENLQHGL